ncbi:MAG: DUF4040 domain-containing protein [Clostridia bacterium]|nr:DUF4040 domain-containing protein [Clostridia bacterium]
MEALNVILLLFVIVCGAAVSLTKNLLSSVVIFTAQGLVLSVIWILLRSPDLAITEASVGAGVSSILMFAALKKIDAIDKKGGSRDENAKEKSAENPGE